MATMLMLFTASWAIFILHFGDWKTWWTQNLDLSVLIYCHVSPQDSAS